MPADLFQVLSGPRSIQACPSERFIVPRSGETAVGIEGDAEVESSFFGRQVVLICCPPFLEGFFFAGWYESEYNMPSIV